MSLHVLTIPESPKKLAVWIQEQIGSSHFGEFVAQQQIIRDSGPVDKVLVLEEILGPLESSKLENGLEALSLKQLRLLLANPGALVELHSFVFEQSIAPWIGQESHPHDQQALVRLKQNIFEANRREKTTFLPTSNTRIPSRRSFLVPIFVAASVLMIVGLTWLIVPDLNRKTEWGWLAKNAMPQNATSSEYFVALADGSEAWFNKVPNDEVAYLKRLEEFRDGCQLLIDAPHAPLSNEDRTWLVQKCKDWKVKLDQQWSSLTNLNKASFEKQLLQTNETARKTTKTLREKAKSKGAI